MQNKKSTVIQQQHIKERREDNIKRERIETRAKRKQKKPKKTPEEQKENRGKEKREKEKMEEITGSIIGSLSKRRSIKKTGARAKKYQIESS